MLARLWRNSASRLAGRPCRPRRCSDRPLRPRGPTQKRPARVDRCALGGHGRHPGMGVGTPRVSILFNHQRLNSIGQRYGRHLAGSSCKTFQSSNPKPFSTIRSVRGPLDVTGREFIAMNLSTRLRDRLHLQTISRDIPRHVGQDGKARPRRASAASRSVEGTRLGLEQAISSVSSPTTRAEGHVTRRQTVKLPENG